MFLQCSNLNMCIQFLELELALKSEKREYDELTAKYELLEEEHVVTKSKLVMDRENVQG